MSSELKRPMFEKVLIGIIFTSTVLNAFAYSQSNDRIHSISLVLFSILSVILLFAFIRALLLPQIAIKNNFLILYRSPLLKSESINLSELLNVKASNKNQFEFNISNGKTLKMNLMTLWSDYHKKVVEFLLENGISVQNKGE